MDVNSIGNNFNVLKTYSTDITYENNKSANLDSKVESLDTQKSEKKENEEKNQNRNEYNKKDLDKAVKKLNKFLEDDRTHAEYSVHKDLGTIMIKIIDEDTNKVILEVPSKKILDMVASMCKEVGLLDKKAWFIKKTI